MDLMDPIRRKRHGRTILIGYGLVGCALILMTILLLFVAYGYGYKNGQVIQNGLLFLSSSPSPAQIYINGARYKSTTDTKLTLPAGTYDFNLERSGYRDWQRSITVTGGRVELYTYPLLLPADLTATTRATYASAPGLVSQSTDRRWLLVAQPGSLTTFDLYDLHSPNHAPVVLALPAQLLSGTPQKVSAVAWADDTTHVLLAYTAGGHVAYVLLDRTHIANSVNLTKALYLASSGVVLSFDNGRYDHYFELASTGHTLSRASLKSPAPVLSQRNVLAYAAYGNDTLLYATPDPADRTKVAVDLSVGSRVYPIRTVAAKTAYLLALGSYSGKLYAAVSASSEDAAYIYSDPVGQIANKQLGVAVPLRAFRIAAPDHVSFAPGGQYVIFEHGATIVSYDLEEGQSFLFTLPDSLDKPQAHVEWMDGARLTYVAHGQVIVLDYDDSNRQVLVSADPRYPVMFDSSYKFMYTLVPSAAVTPQELLTSTSLLTPADQ